MGEIICANLTKVWGCRHRPEVEALSDVSISVRHGILVVIGPSGCGKSTLLMLLAGLEMPTGGTITYNGKPVTGLDADRSLIFQQPSLSRGGRRSTMSRSVSARGMGKKERRQQAEQFLRQVGLREFAHKHPHELSGGMQQRAAIARVSALGADVLLMDEPFAALDVQTRFHMQSFLLDIWQGLARPVVFVTPSHRRGRLSRRPRRHLHGAAGAAADSVSIDMPRPRNVISPDFERYRALFVERLRSRSDQGLPGAGARRDAGHAHQ